MIDFFGHSTGAEDALVESLRGHAAMFTPDNIAQMRLIDETLRKMGKIQCPEELLRTVFVILHQTVSESVHRH